jgi:G:T-mismatch repair DNA endonuclease (very short patch repair protein)
MICEYGCEGEGIYQIGKGKKWCCSKQWQSCSESKKKNRNNNLGKKRSYEVKLKFKNRKKGTGMLGKKHSEETKKVWRKNRSGSNNPMYGKKHSEKSRKAIGEKSKRFQGSNNPMYGKKHSEKSRKAIGEKSKQKIMSKESREKIGKKIKELYKDPSFLKKYRDGLNTFPNKVETSIISLLKNISSNYKYCGDRSFWINGKNPDFIDIKNKRIIEIFGDYYHGEEYRRKVYSDFTTNKEHEKGRIDYFKKGGYETLVIWENELKNIEEVESKIQKFEESI